MVDDPLKQTANEAHMTDAVTNDLKKGQIVIFQGYTALEADQTAILNAGERVKIESIDGDAVVVYSVDRKDGSGNPIGDQAFPEELQPTGNPEDDAPVEEVKAKGKSKSKSKAKGAEAQPQADNEPTLPGVADGAATAEAGGETTAEGETQADAEAEAPKAKGKNSTKSKAEKAPIAKINPPVEAAPRTITDSESVKALLQSNNDAVEAAKALVEQGERTDYTLGGVLHHIYSEGIFKGVAREDGTFYEGKRGFSDFVEQHLNVAYRKAMYLIAIYTTFRRLNVDEAKIGEIGWAKAKELVRIARKQNADGDEVGLEELEKDFDELVDFAKKNTRESLIAHIGTKYLDASTDAEGRTRANSYKFVLSGEAADTVNSALDSAKLKTEGDLNAAFELIVGEWAILSADLTLDQVLAQVQNRFGVTLAVVEGEAAVEQEEQNAAA